MAKKKVNIEKREMILKEAARLFKERGFGSASMRELASRVGMEAASIYNHIRSKDEMLEEICFRIGNEYIIHLSEIEHADMTCTEKMKALISLHVRLVIADADAVSVANNEWKSLTETKLKTFQELRRAYEKRFAAIITDGIAKKEFKPLNVSVVLFSILSALRWIEFWYKPKKGITGIQLENDLIALLMDGISA